MEARLILFLVHVIAIVSVDGILNSTLNEHLLYDQDGPSSRGTDFFVGFLPNVRDVTRDGPLLQLLVSTDEPEPVTFTVSVNDNLPAAMKEGFPLTTTVSYGEVKKIKMHVDMAPTSTASGTNQIERSKAIRIRTEGGKKVSIQGFNDDTRTSDGFLAFPCDAMRNSIFNRFEYLVLAGDQQAGLNDPKKNSLFLIIPCDDNTVVRLEPSQIVTLGGLSDLSSPPPLQIRPGGSGSFTANAGQTILIEHPDDLSGTIIRGSKPLIIFSGHECGEVPLDVTACDHLVEQMPPGMAHGQTFFLVPLAARVSGDFFRVGTLRDGTQITITCVNSEEDDPKNIEPIEGDSLIDRGETLTFLTPRNEANDANYKPSYCCLDASNPVVVAQYSMGYSSDSSLVGKPATEVGDPFMNIIPPVTQYMNNYTATSLDGVSGPFPYRYVNLAIAAEFFDNSAIARQQIRIGDSAATPLNGYIPFYCSNNEICGYGAQVEVTSGTINIYHERPDVGLSVTYYAYQQQNSYGFPQGYELTPISAPTLILQDIIVPENMGTITVSIPRVRNLNIRSDVELNHQSTDPEEAKVGEDYVDFGIVTLIYRGGDRQESLMEFDITILDDDVIEPTERFQIVGVPRRNIVIPIPTLTVTILDDDGDPTPNVFFDPTSYVVNENGGTVTLTIRTDVLGGPQGGAVQFYTEDGAATAPGDYTSIPISEAIPVNFGSGQLSTTVTVSIQNDNTMELDENFFGRLRRSGTGDVLITQNRAEVTIVNDDVESATVSISPSSYEVSESESAVNVVVTKTGNFLMAIQGALTTSFVSAGASDYDHGVYQFVIQPMLQQVTIPISIIDDAMVEQLREQFLMTISLQPQPGVSLGNSQGSVTIVDNDVEIGFNPVRYQVNEDAPMITFVVENRNPDRETEYQVQFTTIDGSAIQATNGDGDYINKMQDITFSPGDQLKRVNVTIIDDNIFENLEEFSAQLTTLDGRVIIAESDAVVQIVDDDNVVDISISPLGYEVDESANAVSVTVQKSGTFSLPISGSIITTTGTAGSTDFTGGTYPFIIMPNEAIKTVTIPIINDETVEQLREQFSISLIVEAQPGLSVGNSQTSVTIVDDDGIVISLQPSTVTVAEGSDSIFRVVATGDSELPYSVQFTTADGTAQAPGDYRPSNVTLGRQQLLPNGFEIKIPVEDDSVLEAEERFQVRLQLTQQSLDLGVVNLGQSVGEVTIIDNDTVSIGFNPAAYSVEEDSNNIIFFIQNLNPDMERDVIIEFMTVEGAAIDGNDYLGTTQTITFEPGQSITTVQVMIFNDNVYEGLEGFFAQLTTTDSGVNIFEPDAAIQITDNDEIMIQFNPISYTVTEGGSTQLIIEKIGTAEQPVTVSISTQEGIANNSDFTQLINVPVTFEPNEVEKRITIATKLDSLVEGIEDFTTELTAVSNRVLIIRDTADIRIQETANVIVEFQPNIYIVNENDGMVSLTIVKRTPTTKDITVYLSTFNGSAIAPADYLSTVNQEVTFTPSEIMVMVNIPIQRDGVFEGDETFTASLTLVPGSTGIEIGQQSNAVIVIMDDTLTISFSSLEYTISENDGAVEVCLTTSSTVSGGLTVVLLAQQSVPAIASDGQDFIGGEYRVQFPDGVSQHCTDIPIVDDSIALEVDELFLVKFDTSQLPDGVEPDLQNTSTVTIIDNDDVSVFFEKESDQVLENEGSVSVCVVREGIIAQGFSIAVATRDLQAEAGSDYEQVTLPLLFRPGDEKQCFNIPVLPDELDEGKEDVEARITFVPDGVVVSQPEVATISILDINVLVVEFNSPNYSVLENQDTVSLCLTTSIGSDQLLSVIVSTAPKNATDGDDYIGHPRVVSITASPGPSETCFEIDIIDDNVVESDEEFLVNFQIQSGSDAQIGNVGSACIQIIDDDVLTVQFSSPDYSVQENEDTVTLCLTTNIGSNQPVSATISTVPKTATADVDYNGTLQVVSIPSSLGGRETCFDIVIINDNAVENDEEFLVNFEIEPDSDVQIGAIDSTCVRIIDDDDDVLTVEFSSPDYSVPENEETVTVCLQTDTGNNKPVSVMIFTISKTATAGVDYSQSPQNISIPPFPGSRSICFKIDIFDDNIDEDDEEFLVSLEIQPDSNAQTGEVRSSCVRIIDDDVVIVEFSSPDYSVVENESTGTVTVCLGTRIGSTRQISVIISTSPKTATAGSDYSGGPRNISIPASIGPREICFEIDIIDDNFAESDEEFLVSLQTQPGSDAQIGAVGSTCVRIIDNDEIRVVFESESYSIQEDGGSVSVCVRTNGMITEAFSIIVATTNLSPVDAMDGRDYGRVSTTLTFRPNEDRKCFDIPILNDQLDEGTESFSAEILSVPTGMGVVIGTPGRTIISITDDDVLINFASPTYTILEDGRTVSICLTTSGSNDEPLRVAISTIPRSASPGADYTVTTQNVIIPDSNLPSEFCFDIGITNDDNVEPNEVFLVSLQVPADTDAEAGTVSTTSVTIVDDDVVTVNFGSSTYTISEDGGSVEVCLTTNVGINERVTLSVSIVQMSALAGRDYDGQSQLVTLPASTGPSQTCFDIPIIDDGNLEGNEEFCVNFQLPFGFNAQPGDITSTCVTIIDDDEAAVVEFVETEYSVVENEGEVEVCLRLQGSIGSSVVVQLNVSSQTAQANLDYLPRTSNFITFRIPGNSIACPTFGIVDDAIALEGNETFVVEVVPGLGPAVIGTKNRAVITIEDDDVVRVRPSAENEIVFESDGAVQVCLIKDRDTARPLQVTVIVGETAISNSSATAGSDFMASISTIAFGEQDRESCMDVQIFNDAVPNELPEVFQVNFTLSQQDELGSELINPVSMVTIIDDDVDTRIVNDSVVADPLFTAPVLGGGQLCYEIHGEPNIILNLVSDKCTSVNANYASMNIASDGNIISAIGIKAADTNGNCHNIEVRLTPPEINSPLSVHVDGVDLSGIFQVDGVRVRTYTNRVRVSVPNCELIDLVMWVLHMKVNDQDMLKFVISRGVNLAPTSHGLIGQFWNIPVSIEKYSGPLQPGYESFLDRDILYLITVTPVTGGETRTFLGELHSIAWDQRTGPCYYVGSVQGGRTAEIKENESVIEGQYTDYRVKDLFDDEFTFSEFEENRCA